MEEKKEDFSQIPPAGAPPDYNYAHNGQQNYGATPPYGAQQYGAQHYEPNKVDPEVHYMPEGETEINATGFESHDVRRLFVRKVYSILFGLLLITGIIIALFILVDPIRDWDFNGGWTMISIGWGVFFCIYIILVCSCCGVKNRYPLNMVFLVLMACSMGVSLGALCCFLDFDAIVAAGFGTVCIVAVVTGLTFWSKFDITRFTHILFLLPFAFMFTWLWFPIFGGDAGYYTWMSLAVAMMTGFLAWDTKVILGGGRYELGPDQHIEAVVQLYYDIVYIFYYLLLIFSRD